MKKSSLASGFRIVKAAAFAAAFAFSSLLQADWISAVTIVSAPPISQFGPAENMINGSGFVVTGPMSGTHSTTGSHLFQGKKSSLMEIVFDLGSLVELQDIRFWNGNRDTYRNVKQMEVWVSTTNNQPASYQYAGTFMIPRATVQPDYSGFLINLADPDARFVKFRVLAMHSSSAGEFNISEVRFNGRTPVPDVPDNYTQPSDYTYPSDAVVSILDYGVDLADNATDDTAAIQAAITASVNTARVIYFPNGVYNVSDTLKGIASDGKFRPHLRLQGQSRNGVIFKLKNSCPGFTDAAAPKGVIEPGGIYDQGGNTAFNNVFRSFTVDVGSGNPGAIAIDFLANNQGGIYDVLLKASTGSGKVGLNCIKGIPGPCLLQKIEIRGFETGIAAGKGTQYSVVLEDVVLSGQRSYGILLNGISLSARRLVSVNSVPAIYNNDTAGQIVLIDSQLNGGSSSQKAISFQGTALVRNVTQQGYGVAIENRTTGQTITGGSISEYLSHAPFELFASKKRTLNLPIEETPVYNSDPSRWVAVEPEGFESSQALRDAIQKANNEGKDTIYFPHNGTRRTFLINSTVRVWGTVRRIMGMGNQIKADRPLVDQPGKPPVFIFENIKGPDVTVMDFTTDLTGGESVTWFEHATTKPLVIQAVMLWGGSAYRNTVTGGKLFVQDVAAAGFDIQGPQTVYMRQANAEMNAVDAVDDNGTPVYIRNTGGTLWLFGFKTERSSAAVTTRAGGRTEMLGGLLYPATSIPVNRPAFVVEDAEATLAYTTEAFSRTGDYEIQVREIQDGETRELYSNLSPSEPSALPRRNGGSHVPLYCSFPANGMTQSLLPIHDAFVRGGNSAASNYGADPSLWVKYESNSSYSRESYLMFDLAGISSATNMNLVLPIVSAGADASQYVLEWVPNTTWTESTLTWNNRPPATGGTIASWTSAAPGEALVFPIPANIVSQTLNNRMALRLRSSQTGANRWFTAGAKENPDNDLRARLEVD